MSEISFETACANVVVRTILAVDGNDMDAFEAQLTEDCLMTRGEHHIAGRDTITGLVRQRSPDRVTRHMLTHVLVEPIDGGGATAISYFSLYESDRSQGDMPYPLTAPAAVGEYRDVFRLTDAGWRIAERHILPVFVRQEPST